MPNLRSAIDARAEAIARQREILRAGRASIEAAFFARPNTPTLLASHRRLVDGVLRALWDAHRIPGDIALLAVGGYGRGELYPYSDVDVLMLVPENLDGETATIAEHFVSALWDVGLEIAPSVRTVGECNSIISTDVTVQTSLLEHRLLCGSKKLYSEFGRMFEEAMDPLAFYQAKTIEQQQRHIKYHDTAYNLEPNVKESPGGLRDLQTVTWIARAAGIGCAWTELAQAGLITPAEARTVARHERFLGSLRIRLHYLARRREDRLVFDQQRALARSLKLDDTATKLASERLMQHYYRAAGLVRQANVILLQNLHARLFPPVAPPTPLNDDFQLVDELLDVRSEELFARRPIAMLDAFLMLERNPGIKGMSARTLRTLWRNRTLIDTKFRKDQRARTRFLQMLREPRGITHELRRMNLYGILGRYLPAWGRIVGQMQHDLFHVYTVDEHSLMVIRNLRRFCETQYAHEYPLCSQLITDFDRREVLYIAGLFHDIAKGRRGDHSLLGGRDARRFCRLHNMPAEDTDLVVWLVEKHLLMSAVSQKQDTSDPNVISAFAASVRTERRLSALYLFTVADIRGTSPKVWNAWKGRLLEDLYRATRERLAAAGGSPTLADSVQKRKQEARRLLRLYAVPEGAEEAMWSKLDSVYFQRHSGEEAAWHARNLYHRVDSTEAFVRARLSRAGEGMEVMVYVPDQKDLFARICGFFGRAGLSILDAKIYTTQHGYALDTFAVHHPLETQSTYRHSLEVVQFELKKALVERRPLEPPRPGRVSRRVKHFPLSPEVRIGPDDKDQHYIIEIVAADRPGLLAQIAYVLASRGINVVSAKINTLGERAEDTFLVDAPWLKDANEVMQLETELYTQLRLP